MNIHARKATAADFDRAAQHSATRFWFWLIVAGATFYIAKWYAIVPGIFTMISALKSIFATRSAGQLREGTYPIPNPNNGAPDGDARNYPESENELVRP